MSFLLSEAYAVSSQSGQQNSSSGSIVMLAVFMVLIYLLVWYPQSKRIKKQRDLINHLSAGDEIITNGGILGKIVRISDDFIVLLIDQTTEISLQKTAVSVVVPKGTFKKCV